MGPPHVATLERSVAGRGGLRERTGPPGLRNVHRPPLRLRLRLREDQARVTKRAAPEPRGE